MNSQIEESLVAWLRARGVACDIHAGQSADIINPETPCVVVDASDCKSIVGNLVKGTILITGSTPINYGGTLAVHRALSAQLSGIMGEITDENLAGITSALLAVSLTYAGSFYVGETPSNMDARWQTTHELTLGILS